MTNKSAQANKYLSDNYQRYIDIIQDSLTLKKYEKSGLGSGLIDKGDHYELTLNMKSPMVIVISVE